MDRINMNVFKQIKKKKEDVKTVNSSGSGLKSKSVSKVNKPSPSFNKEIVKISEGMEDLNLYNYTNNQSNQSKQQMQPRVMIKKDVNKVTSISGYVKDSEDSNKAEFVEFKVATRSQPKPNLDFNNQPFPVKRNEKGVAIQSPEDKMVKDVLVNAVKTNKMTFGTTQMMENERIHADEAIESGIYVTWSTKTEQGNTVDCFRIGSNSMCICNHGFTSHEKILTKKKQSSKCTLCKCRAFAYIPLYPEEIGEYWMPYQGHFDYKTWRAKCKCKHTWNEHSAEQFLKCKKCNCFAFNSNFCCAVCDKFWQDHEMIWELEHERYMGKKPIGQDFVPFTEMPEMYDALYKK